MPEQTRVEALKAEGDRHFQSSDYNRALAKYQEAAGMDASNPVYWSSVAACYEKLGQFDEMEGAARRCLAVDENCVEGHFLLAAALKAQNDLPGCIAAMEAGWCVGTEKVEAARAALMMAVEQHLGTNPDRVEQATMAMVVLIAFIVIHLGTNPARVEQATMAIVVLIALIVMLIAFIVISS